MSVSRAVGASRATACATGSLVRQVATLNATSSGPMTRLNVSTRTSGTPSRVEIEVRPQIDQCSESIPASRRRCRRGAGAALLEGEAGALPAERGGSPALVHGDADARAHQPLREAQAADPASDDQYTRHGRHASYRQRYRASTIRAARPSSGPVAIIR